MSICLLPLAHKSIGQESIGHQAPISYDLALTHYQNQEYQAALDMLSMLMESGTEDLDDVLVQAAMIADKLGDTATAKKYAQELMKLDSTNRTGLSQLASIYEREENAPLAIKYYGLLAKTYPDNGYYQRKLGRLYQISDLKREAFKHYENAYNSNSRDLMSIRGMAKISMQEKEYLKADSLLQQGLSLDSTHIGLLLDMALVKFRKKDYESTIDVMEKAKGKLVLKPHQHKMLGYAYLQIDSLDRSIYHLNQALTDTGTNDYVHYNLGIAYEKQKNIEYAKHHFSEAIAESLPENIDLYHRNMARLYNLEDDHAASIPHYKDAFKYGGDPILLFFLARASEAYYEDKAVAVRYYKKYLKSPNQNEDYRQYSSQRVKALTEYLHQVRK